MSKLIIKNKLCKIVEENKQLLEKLDLELSYDVIGAEYSSAYKRGYMDPFSGQYVNWDGKNYLLNDDLSFKYGLKDRVINFYKKNNIELEIEDLRPKKSKANPINIQLELKKNNKTPRDYQIKAAEVAIQNDFGIIRAATGSGKTLIVTLIVAMLGKKSAVFVIGTDLLYQFHEFFTKIFPNKKIGIIGDGLCEIGDINIISVWTAGKAFGLNDKSILLENDEKEKSLNDDNKEKIINLLSKCKVFIFDECHICSCSTVQTITSNIEPEHVYGMSASPWRDDGSDLLIESVLGSRIVDISATKLINEGYLVKPIIKFVRVPQYHKALKKNYQSVYRTYICENDVRNNLIVDYTEKLVKLGYKPLVLYNSVKHGEILQGLISKKVSCVLLSGKDKMEVRKKAKQDIESGEIQVIIASKIFDIGVDIPALSGLIVAGSGKSSVRALQRIGRVIRPYKGKKQAAIVDFIDQTHYLKKHSQARKKIYSLEEGFDVKWQKI